MRTLAVATVCMAVSTKTAAPFAGRVQRQCVVSRWYYVLDLLDEMKVCPIGSHNDQVAAAAMVLARNGGNFKGLRPAFKD